MSDLYWLVTLGTLSTFCCIFTIIFFIASVILGIVLLVSSEYNKEYSDFTEKDHKNFTKSFKIISIFLVIFTFGDIFIPNERQLYTIYGIGTVIDYAKGSKEVQKLPDNAVKCLNIWLEEHSDTTTNKR